MTATYYKIRSKKNPEMFLKGTPASHSYDKTGRIFSSIGRVRGFITGVLNSHSDYTRRDLGDWEVVELAVTVKDVKDLHMIIKPEKLMSILAKA